MTQVSEQPSDLEAWCAKRNGEKFAQDPPPVPMFVTEGHGVRKPEGVLSYVGRPMLLKAETAAQLIGWSIATFMRRKRDDPDFPPGVEFGPNNVRYYTLESIHAYVRRKVEKAEAKARGHKPPAI